MSGDRTPGGISVVYDGACPVCRTAVHGLALGKQHGTPHLVDARTAPEHRLCLLAGEQGLDLDRGMLIEADGKLYYGAEVTLFLAHYGEPGRVMTKIARGLGASRIASAAVYAMLRGIRRLLLWVRGVGRLGRAGGAHR